MAKCKLCMVQAKLIKCLDKLLTYYRCGGHVPVKLLDDLQKYQQKVEELNK